MYSDQDGGEWFKIVVGVHSNWFFTGYRTKADAKRIGQLTTQVAQSKFYIGQRIVATFASLNKNDTLGQYIRECQKPEDGEPYWDRTHYTARKNWSVIECQVWKVIQMTSAEYDHFAINVMESRPDLFDGFGGSQSDYKIVREIKEYWEMTREEENLWGASSYGIVAIIEAPGRESIVVNPEGYSYARYVGLWPKLLSVALMEEQVLV